MLSTNPRYETSQRCAETAIVAAADELAGNDEAPGRGIDEQKSTAEVPAPVAVRNLVTDQRASRRIVGNAQQRLGQAHQSDALST
jgi:hypothetical protein